jgi:dUTP pyrophosphatase
MAWFSLAIFSIFLFWLLLPSKKKVVKFVKTNPLAKIPTYSKKNDSGADLYSVEDVKLWAQYPQAIDTGLRIKLPEGYEAQIRPRSGLSLKNITVSNTPGTIDNGYTGPLKVILVYHGPSNTSYEIRIHDRIAQMVLSRYEQTDSFEEVSELEQTDRGEGGMGSTGK